MFVPHNPSPQLRSAAERALPMYEAACAPAGDDAAEMAIAALHEGTIPRKGEQADLAVRLEVYTPALACYPSDVLGECVREWMLPENPSHRWFPALGEVLARLNAKVGRRMARRDALRKIADAPPHSEPVAALEPPADPTRPELAEALAKMHAALRAKAAGYSRPRDPKPVGAALRDAVPERKSPAARAAIRASAERLGIGRGNDA